MFRASHLSRLSFLLLAVLAAPSARSQDGAVLRSHAEEEVPEPGDLSVLYAGDPGSEREAHFLAFLEDWFLEVSSISLADLSTRSAEGFDVVIADWKPAYDHGQYQQGVEPPSLRDPTYSRPTVAIGRVGASIPGGKIDWL